MEFENAFIKVVLCGIYKCLQVCENWNFFDDLLLSKKQVHLTSLFLKTKVLMVTCNFIKQYVHFVIPP
jgi:hypothetical protein